MASHPHHLPTETPHLLNRKNNRFRILLGLLFAAVLLPAYLHAGGPGNGLDLDGSDDYLEAAAGLSSLTALSLELMVYHSQGGGNSPSLIALGGGNKVTLKLRDYSGGFQSTFSLSTTDGSYVLKVDSELLAYDRWHHIAAVWNGSTMTVYYDGEMVANAEHGGTVNFTSGNIRVGSTTSSYSYYSGSLDEIRIWNSARSAENIRSSMFRALSGSESGLIHYYNLNHPSGTTVAQDGAGTADLTLYNMDVSTCWQPSTAWNTWTGGVSGDWQTADNWQLGSVPTTSSNIAIVNASNSAVINGEAYGRNLVLGSGTTLSVSVGGSLHLSQNSFSFGTVSGQGTVRFTGGEKAHLLSGLFGNIIIDDSPGASLAEQTTMTGTLTLKNSDLNLDGNILILGENGSLAESGGRVFGESGHIETTRIFAAGALSGGEDIGGLGFEIVTDAGLGETSIRRGHALQRHQDNHREKAGMYRYFDVTPTSNTSLNATIIYHYAEEELIGLEAEQQLHSSTDAGATWSYAGGAADPAANTVRLEGVDSFSRWTAFTSRHPFDQDLDVALRQNLNDAVASFGDYDADGDSDILLAGEDRDANSFFGAIYQNDNGEYTNVDAEIVGWHQAGGAGWHDYDRDGDLDGFLHGHDQPEILRNDGGDTFTRITGDFQSFSDSCSKWADFDNDGDQDFVIAGFETGGPNTILYRNNGDSTFQNSGADLSGVETCWITVGDYDNDGFIDLVISGYNSGSTTTLLKNNGNGSFSPVNAGLPSSGFVPVAWGDYDGDGDLDLFHGSTSSIYRNDGNEVFTKVDSTTAVYPEAAIWGDYDGDGDLDVLISGSGKTLGEKLTLFYRNDGNDTFTVDDSFSLAVSAFRGGLDFGDYDNDGDLDFLIVGSDTEGNDVARIYRNNLNFANTPPLPPVNLEESDIHFNEATLHWQAGSDAETASGLTYNIRLGTSPSPGAPDVISPLASADGPRLLAARGNRDHTRSITISDLQRGTTYYWSVQAIDNSFAGSEFAPERSFLTPDDPPVAATEPVSNITADSATLSGQVHEEGAAEVTDWGIVYAKGSTPTVAANNEKLPATGNVLDPFSFSVTGLTRGENYHVRAYATSIYGTSYGEERIFSPPMLVPGNSYFMPSSPNYIEIPVAETGIFGQSVFPAAFTVECWVNPYTDDDGTVIARDDYQESGKGYAIALNSDTTVEAWVASPESGKTTVVSSRKLDSEEWHHLAMAYDGSELILYIDGVEEGRASGTMAFEGSVPTEIGYSTSSSSGMSGYIDEIRFWHSARTADEIRTTMNRVLTEDEFTSDLAAYYRIDHVAGNRVLDLTTNRYHGTFQSGRLRTSNAPLGQYSTYRYPDAWEGVEVTLSSADGDRFTVLDVDPGVRGVQIYGVDNSPTPATPPDEWDWVSDRRYWGVFFAGAGEHNHRLIHEFSGHPRGDYEFLAGLAIKDENEEWSDLNASLDPDNLTLEKEQQQGGQYIFGWLQDLDRDGDGISDVWENHYFGSLNYTHKGRDRDRDGYTDDQEYINDRNGERDPEGNRYDPSSENIPEGTGYSPWQNLLLMVTPAIINQRDQ